MFTVQFTVKTRGKVLSWEYRSPRKRNSHPPASVILCWVSWERITYLLCVKWFVGLTLEKNPRFTAFLDSNFHTRLAIVTENELGLAFTPRNLPKKFRPDPCTFYLVIVVTNRQTNAGDYINPRESFRGDNKTTCRAKPVSPRPAAPLPTSSNTESPIRFYCWMSPGFDCG